MRCPDTQSSPCPLLARSLSLCAEALLALTVRVDILSLLRYEAASFEPFEISFDLSCNRGKTNRRSKAIDVDTPALSTQACPRTKFSGWRIYTQPSSSIPGLEWLRSRSKILKRHKRHSVIRMILCMSRVDMVDAPPALAKVFHWARFLAQKAGGEMSCRKLQKSMAVKSHASPMHMYYVKGGIPSSGPSIEGR